MEDTVKDSPFIPITDEEYIQLYFTLKKNSNQDEVVRNGITTSMLNKYDGKSIDLMSIGTGTAWLEDEIIRHPDLKVNSILAIEPNHEYAKQLREKSSNWDHTTCFIDTSYFSENYDTEMRFDVILMIHSIYYLENPIDAIIKLKSFLKDGGQIMIVIRGKKGSYELVACLYEYFKIPQSICKYGGGLIETGVIVDGLKKSKITYKMKEVMAFHDVSDFIEKKTKPSSSDCVSFFLYTMYEKLDKELQDDIYELVRNTVTVTKDNRFMFGNMNSFIYVENN